MALLAVLGGAGGLAVQAIYDPRLTDEVKSTNLYVAVSSIDKPFGGLGRAPTSLVD